MEFDRQLLESLREAKSVVVLTGAGVSAESGVPTFRDAMTGLWAKYDPEDLATPEAFAADPESVSQWYDERRCALQSCQPNAGHVALAQLQQLVLRRGGKYALITQNVDRLHQKAGSKGVIELHGSIWVWRCTRCKQEHEELGPAFAEHPPLCECGAPRRPGVVWFGEMLPPYAMDEASMAAGACDFFMSLGTSGMVYPAAGLVDVAMRNDARLLEINPESTPVSDQMHWSIRGKTGEVLPSLIAAI